MASEANDNQPVYDEYCVEVETEAFFQKTLATREQCHAKTRELFGNNINTRILPVQVQGACSYTLYVGPGEYLAFVVQFRLKSLALEMEVVERAREVYGTLAPWVTFKGVVGEEVKAGDGGEKGKDREVLYVYCMSRVKGVTHLDFILKNGFPEDSADNMRWRKNLMAGVAHFMAISWNNPQPTTREYRTNLRQTYLNDLRRLRAGLPARFRPIVQRCIDSLDAIMSLPMVLLHHDFGACNVIVDETTCHLSGVVGWAEAAVEPFGVNLHSLQAFTGKLHLRNGWTRYGDYDALQEVFWDGFKKEVVGGVSDEEVGAIKMARVLGLLRSSRFTSRLANEPEPVPIRDDERGRYNMMSLDGFLIDEKTRFDGW